MKNLEEAELYQQLFAKANKIAPQIAKETHAQYFERILEEFSWCIGISKYRTAIVKGAPITLATMNRQGDFIIISESIRSMLGYSASELRGQHFSCLFADKQRLLIKSLMPQKLSFSTDLMFVATLVTKEGLTVSTLWDLVWSESDALFFCAAQELSSRLEVPDLNSITS